MKEQAQLKEEMAYQYKIGNFEVRKSNFVSLLTVIFNRFLATLLICYPFVSLGCSCYSKKVGPRCCHVRKVAGYIVGNCSRLTFTFNL